MLELNMLFPAAPDTSFKGDVLLVHGIFDTGYVFTRIARALSAQGWNAYTPTMLPKNGQCCLDTLAEQIAQFMSENQIGQSPERPWMLVGFSMGGLVSRALLQNHGVPHWPIALVTLGSPHHGSILTYFFWGAGTRDMRPTSRFLKQLKLSDDRIPESLPIHSLRTPLDLMIVPSRSSIWRRAHNEVFWSPLHAWLLIHKGVIQRIIEIAESSRAPEERS